jgi:hypothetical protein
VSAIEALKDISRFTGVYDLVRPVLQERRFRDWVRRGKTGPAPDLLKERAIRQYASERGARILVETGTFRGDTLASVYDAFDKLYSIELSPELHARAKRRFRRMPKIQLLEGDSAQALPGVLEQIDRPALFWLDAHYSSGVTARGFEDTPIRAELAAILSHRVQGHVLLIDDARHFSPEFGYPSLAEVERFVHETAPQRSFRVEHDLIRIV